MLREELLAAFPKAEFNEDGVDFDPDSFAAYVGDAAGVVVGLEPIIDPVLTKCPELRIAAKYGVGLDNVDQAAADKHQVKIGWTGGVNRRCVAEMTLCFMLGLSRHVLFSARNLVRQNDWTKNGGYDLSGRTVGIIGVGFIGKDLVDLLNPIG